MQKYKYWLSIVRSISNTSKCRLVSELSDAASVYEADRKRLLETGAFNSIIALNDFLEEKKKKDELEEKLLYMEKNQISLVTIEDENYPVNLRNIIDHPYGIFVKGKMPMDFSSAVSMVGTRNCSGYGQESAKEIAFEIAKRGGIVISGLAKGIDGASHMGALEANGKTVAVLGCGVDICYPKLHSGLYNRILEYDGCIISELEPQTSPLPMFFPARNRIISGLSNILIVIEAKKASGSLITADFALEQGRDIWALPGRITDVLSYGSNRLISQGAGIITSKNDLIETLCDLKILNDDNQKKIIRKKKCLEKDQNLVYSCLGFNAKSLDELLYKTGMPFTKLIDVLDQLIKMGMITETAKNHYLIRND